MLRACIAALALTAGVALVAAQTQTRPDVYAAAVARYQHGDLDGAARAVAGWRSADFRDVLGRLAASPDAWKQLEAAAMLHTDLVVQEREVEDARIALHIGVADAIVGRLTAFRTTVDSDTRDGIAAFQERWYELGASVFLAMTAPEQADVLLGHGLRLFKRSARLRMYAGIVEEMRAHILDGNLHDPRVIAMMAGSAARRRIVLAEHAYQDALEIDPTLAEARVRLGRMLSLRHELKPARRELEAAEAAAPDPRTKHLAHLFLGALSEVEQNLPAARDHYAAAAQLFPRAQTALVALSYAFALTGREGEARRVLADIGSGDGDDLTDPFGDYLNGGISHESYRWLRAQVQ